MFSISTSLSHQFTLVFVFPASPSPLSHSTPLLSSSFLLLRPVLSSSNSQFAWIIPLLALSFPRLPRNSLAIIEDRQLVNFKLEELVSRFCCSSCWEHIHWVLSYASPWAFWKPQSCLPRWFDPLFFYAEDFNLPLCMLPGIALKWLLTHSLILPISPLLTFWNSNIRY